MIKRLAVIFSATLMVSFWMGCEVGDGVGLDGQLNPIAKGPVDTCLVNGIDTCEIEIVDSCDSAGVDTCNTEPESCDTCLTLKKDIQPIFTNECVECHATGSGTGWRQTGMDGVEHPFIKSETVMGLDFSAGKSAGTLIGIIAHQYEGEMQYKYRVKAGYPDSSYIMNKIDPPIVRRRPTPVHGDPMPQTPPFLSEEQIEKIRLWIEQGAWIE